MSQSGVIKHDNMAQLREGSRLRECKRDSLLIKKEGKEKLVLNVEYSKIAFMTARSEELSDMETDMRLTDVMDRVTLNYEMD